MTRPSLMAVGLLVAISTASGCQTVQRKRVRPTPQPVVERAQPMRVWNAMVQGAVIGEVVRYDSLRDGKPVFVVRNSWRQDLGVIDRLGRAYRFRPHAEEPDWLGTGTVEGGAARILEAASVELQEIDLTAAQASTFNLWASSEVRAQEAGAKRETPSPEPPDRGGEIPQLPEGTPQ